GGPRARRGGVARGVVPGPAPLLIDQSPHSDNPDAALAAFDRFLGNLHGGARLLLLLRENLDLMPLVALLLGTAPRLADTLAINPQVIDALLDPHFFGAHPDAAKLASRFEAAMGEAASYEDFLARVRLSAHPHMF